MPPYCITKHREFKPRGKRTNFFGILFCFSDCERISLYTREKIVCLNTCTGEYFCPCSEDEWQCLFSCLARKGVAFRQVCWIDCMGTLLYRLKSRFFRVKARVCTLEDIPIAVVLAGSALTLVLVMLLMA